MKKFILFPFLLSSLIIGQSYVLNFDGSNDYVSVAASDNASTKFEGQFTLSAWVFIEGADTVSYTHLTLPTTPYV